MIKLIQGDCFDKSKLIKDKSVDLVILDPPYNIGKAKWDKWKSVNEYVEWIGKLFLEAQRILKDNGSFYWFHNHMPYINRIMIWLEDNSNFIFKQFIVWNKRYNGSPRKYYFDNVIQSNIDRNYRLLAEYCMFYTFQDESIYKKLFIFLYNIIN
jgi:site-specific DNA-methyltransferase (adenine-specific)